MKPEDFIDLADDLQKNALALAEAKIRTAVSRAYYFILHKIRNSLGELGYIISRGSDTHVKVVETLFNTKSSKAVSVAKKLGSLRTKRNEADYDLDKKIYQKQDAALLAIGEAKIISSDFDSIDKDELKSS